MTKHVDGASLRAFRVLFGLTMAAGALRFLWRGFLHQAFGGSTHRVLAHFGSEWLQPLSERGMMVVECVAFVAALGLAQGRFQRTCAAVFGTAFAWIYFSDVTWYLNHAYLVCCLCVLFVLVPVNRERVPLASLLAFRVQVGLVYVFAGLAKLQGDWLLKAQPMRIWLQANDDFPVLGRLFELPATAYAMSWVGAAFDLSIVPLMCFAKTRRFAYPVALAFHAMTGLLFQIGLFPWIMSGALLVFFPPDWPRRLRGWRDALPDETTESFTGWRSAALGVWLVVQVLLPLRQHLYPGNRLWTEQGFRFAWNVMVMEKNGALELRSVDRVTGAESWADLSSYLTPVQLKQAATQPDLVLQLAHWVADDARAAGRDVAVFAHTRASLNGRSGQQLIDPSVDLSKVEDDFAPRTWVLPLATE